MSAVWQRGYRDDSPRRTEQQPRRKSAEREDSPMSKQLERQLLPDDLVKATPEPVRKAQKRAEAAIAESKRAVGEAHRARREADAAPDQDAAAELAAYRAG